MTKRIEIRINKPIRGYPVGHRIRILVDKNGVPMDRYWRDRFKDAPIDRCIEIVKRKKSKGD